jgi:hypothetical protein
MSEKNTETAKAKKPRAKRVYHLIEIETMQVVNTEPTLKLLREFQPTDAQSGKGFIEVAQIGKEFVLRKVTISKREAAK